MSNETSIYEKPSESMVLFVSVLYMASSVILAIPYTTCIVIMTKTKSIWQHTSYKIMITLGIFDLVLLFFIGPLCSAMTFFNVTTDRQWKVTGAGMMGCYFTSTTLLDILAIERALKTWWPKGLWETLFGKKRLLYWIGCCIAYGGVVFSIDINYFAFYLPDYFTWSYEGPLFRFYWDKITVYGTTVLLIVSYTSIGIKLRMLKQNLSNANDIKDELSLFYQCFYLAAIFNILDIVWYWAASQTESWAFVLANMMWIVNTGGNGLVYLAFNITLRENIVRVWRRSKLSVMPHNSQMVNTL